METVEQQLARYKQTLASRQEAFRSLFDEAEKSQAALYAAATALFLSGHKVGCRFSGCNCGEVEKFKVAYGEFTRLWNAGGWRIGGWEFPAVQRDT